MSSHAHGRTVLYRTHERTRSPALDTGRHPCACNSHAVLTVCPSHTSSGLALCTAPVHVGSGVPYMVRLRPAGLGVKGGPRQRIPIATGPPPGYAASAGARSELAMDCPRGLPTFFQYGAGTSGAAPAPRVPAPGAAAAPRVPASGAGRAARVPASGAAPARPGCRAAAPQVPRRHPGAAAAARVPGGGSSGAGRRRLGCPSATPGAAAAPQTCAAARVPARAAGCRR